MSTNPRLPYETLRDLRRARDFVRENYSSRLTLEEIAREACISPFHFHRLFTAAFRETPHEFLTRTRLEKAKLMLVQGSYTVTDACFESGYESLGSFSALFARYEGQNPSEFRRIFSIPGMWQLKVIPACMRGFS